MNNPEILTQLANAVRKGQNPMDLIKQMAAQSNPQAAMAWRMMQGKDSRQLRQMVENMARERGTTPMDLARQFGFM